MSNNGEQLVTPSRAQRVDDFKRRTMPLLVWSVCAAIVLVMLVGRAQRFDYIGMAQSPEYEISASGGGMIEAVVVDLFDDVSPGDVVVKLDDALVMASIHTSEATIRLLNAELEATGAQLLSGTGGGMAGWKGDLRRFQIDEEQRRLDILSLRVVTEGDHVEAERLGLELARAETLLDAGLINRNEYDITRLMHQEVRERIDTNLVLLEQTQAEYNAARERRENFEQDLPQQASDEPLLQPLRAAIAVEGQRLHEIELQRASLTLRSPVVGSVSQILGRRGQSVVPGEPIIMIAEQSVQEIVAYLAEEDGLQVRENTPVIISSRGGSHTLAKSVVLRVGPSIQPLPQRLWMDPRIPDYGRAVVIAATPAMNLTPGELVNIKFDPDD
jgi:multidrug resistance efflux pump